MSVLGIRCSNHGYSFAIIDGTKTQPKLIASSSVNAPKGFAKPAQLKWMCQEISDLAKKYSISSICMKGSEGLASRGAAFVDRVEMEAMVFVTGCELGIKRVLKKVKSTIAKDLGQKGKAKYLKKLDTSMLLGFADLDEKEQEAVLAGWSNL
jgi:hypothetical protein